MYGYGAGELDGQPSSILYPTPDQHARAVDVYDALALGGTSRRIELRRRKDGSTFWNRADGRAVDFQDPHKGSVWIVEDVTEERKAAEELQRVLAEQQALLNNVVVGIQFTRERKTVRCNRRFEEIFGYGQDELVGRSTRLLFESDEAYAAGGDAPYEAIWGGETQHMERSHVKKDGTRIWCSISGRAVQLGDPSQGSVWLWEDITQEREAEQRIERALAEQELILDNATVGISFVRHRSFQRCNLFL